MYNLKMEYTWFVLIILTVICNLPWLTLLLLVTPGISLCSTFLLVLAVWLQRSLPFPFPFLLCIVRFCLVIVIFIIRIYSFLSLGGLVFRVTSCIRRGRLGFARLLILRVAGILFLLFLVFWGTAPALWGWRSLFLIVITVSRSGALRLRIAVMSWTILFRVTVFAPALVPVWTAAPAISSTTSSVPLTVTPLILCRNKYKLDNKPCRPHLLTCACVRC